MSSDMGSVSDPKIYKLLSPVWGQLKFSWQACEWCPRPSEVCFLGLCTKSAAPTSGSGHQLGPTTTATRWVAIWDQFLRVTCIWPDPTQNTFITFTDKTHVASWKYYSRHAMQLHTLNPHGVLFYALTKLGAAFYNDIAGEVIYYRGKTNNLSARTCSLRPYITQWYSSRLPYQWFTRKFNAYAFSNVGKLVNIHIGIIVRLWTRPVDAVDTIDVKKRWD